MYSMTHPSLAGEADLQPRRHERPGRRRAHARGRVLVINWLGHDGKVVRTSREHVPGSLLVGVEDIQGAREIFWSVDGRITTSLPEVPQRRKRQQ